MRTSDWFLTNSDNSVSVRGADFTETWTPWGHPKGFGCHGCDYDSANKEARPLWGLQLLRGGNHLPVELRSIRDSIPQYILSTIQHYPHWPLELVQLGEQNQRGFLLLHKSNPTLLALLARTLAQHSLWGIHHWGGLLGKDEKRICEGLGYPRKWAALFRKIADIRLAAEGYLSMLLGGLSKPHMARLLSHVSSINLDVILLALNRFDECNLSPSLLHMAASNVEAEAYTHDYVRMNDYAFSTEIYELVEQVRQQNNYKWPFRKIGCKGWLHRYQGRAILDGRGDNLEYPPPPVSPDADWAWVSCLDELREHAHQYKNCALNNHWKLLSGQMALYQSHHWYPEKVVVVMEKEGHEWAVTDVLGPENSLVEDATVREIKAHFEGGVEQ